MWQTGINLIFLIYKLVKKTFYSQFVKNNLLIYCIILQMIVRAISLYNGYW
jgi:hypothetical protein